MASVGNQLRLEKEPQEACHNIISGIASQAWISIRRHFPISSHKTDTESGCDCIVLSPIERLDLIIEFRFPKLGGKDCWNVLVKSRALPHTFVTDFETVLEKVCNSLMIDWQTLGDEIEKILQYVEIRRRNKSMKKKKDESKGIDKFENDIETVEFNCDIVNLYFPHEAKAPRPNYFIAIRIQDEQIIRSISNLQQELAAKEKLLTKGAVPGEALHLTLCNLGLDSADDLLKAIMTMDQIKSQLVQILPTTPFVVQGTSQFYNRAIYAGVKVDEKFLKFRSSLMKHLELAGIEFREDHEVFTPHVTVIKVRRPERKAFGTRNIQSSLYADYVDVIHGKQKIDALYLCAMGGQRRDDGFFVSACELNFNS